MGDGLTIERNTLTAGGLFVLGDDNAIDRNLIRASESYGINATGADLVLTRNRVLVASDHGMTIGGDGLLASGNRVVGVDGNGIVLNGGSPNAQLLGNRVTASDGYGIAVYDTPVVVTGNRASGNGLADYGDTNAEGVNMLTSNRFGTLEFNLAP